MYGFNGSYYGGYNPGLNYTPQQVQPQNGGDERIWVQGEVGAKAYLIAPGSTVPLWDSERQRIFIKSVSAQGVPSMMCLNYAVQTAETPHVPAVEDSIGERVERLEKAFAGLKTKIEEVCVNGTKPGGNDTGV